jgi:hypothetical protein
MEITLHLLFNSETLGNYKKQSLEFKTSQIFLENHTSIPKGIYLDLNQST